MERQTVIVGKLANAQDIREIARLAKVECIEVNHGAPVKTVLHVTCAWCGSDMGDKDGQGVSGTSHGICPDCIRKMGFCPTCHLTLNPLLNDHSKCGGVGK